MSYEQLKILHSSLLTAQSPLLTAKNKIMKKTLLLTIALLFSTIAFAQTFVDESFNKSELPDGWTTSEVGASNWKLSSTTYSGGDTKELMLAWSPIFEGTTRIITTPFDLSGIDEMTVSFKHFFDNFKDNEFSHTIGIATSSDEGKTWNVGWSQAYTVTGVYDVKANFTTPDMGKSNVIFSLFYEGSTNEMDNWFFDDLLIFRQLNYDIRLIDINIPAMIESGEREISFTLQNIGQKSVESFDAKIKASNWESAETVTFEQNISNSEIVQVTYKDKKLNAIAKSKPYTVSVEILSINGNEDQDKSNSLIKKNISVAFNKAQRVPMIEHFSSSTCGPCVAVNQQMHTLTQNNEGKFTYTKFPTAGDPYHNHEALHRTQEYGVTGVPNIFLDGMSNGSKYLTQEQLDERRAVPAYADIRGAFSIEDDNIYVIADFMSYVQLDNVVAFVTVNEKTTTKNTGSNGETEFHHIMMKMLKSKSGNPLNINAGEYQRLEFTHNMSLTNVEDINDLEVALWLQNPITQEVYNSNFAYAYTNHCYPIQNLTSSKNEDENTLTWDAPEEGSPIYYKVYINGQFVTENESKTYSFNSSEESFSAEVIAVYENGKTSVGVAKSFGKKENEEDDITLDAPNSLMAVPASTSSINLFWNPSENATSYNIYRNDVMIKNIDVTDYVDEGLEYNTEYCYTVTAVLGDTESEHSNKVCVKTLGEGVEEIETSLHIYPNPVNDKLYIATEEDVEDVVVYSITGVIVGQQSTVNGQQTLTIDLSDLKSGIYFVKINTEKGNIVKRIIKQ